MAGIVGIYSKENAIANAYYSLFETQHRGQENAGISALGNHSLRTHKGKRLMSKVFHETVLHSFVHPTDYVAIGHVGDKKLERPNIAPVELESEEYAISVAMEGFIDRKVYDSEPAADEGLLGKLFLEKIDDCHDVIKSISHVMNEFDRANYSLVIGLHDKRKQMSQLIGVRDKRGVKPMYFGRTEEGLYISSESKAIDTLEHLGKKFIERRDVVPGEILISDGRFYNQQILPAERKHCAFEWIYTAMADSVIEGKTAYVVRKIVGHLLADLHGIKNKGNQVVIGIPDSGRSVALGLHEATGIPFDEGLTKNQYIGRTYIIPDPRERNTASILKHNPIREVIAGKKIIFGDDSIVRGTISESVAQTLRNSGAKEVELAISYSPIFYPCFSDEPDKKLAAKGMEGMDVFEIGKKVAANLPSVDKVYYNTLENIVKAIGLPEKNLCTMCIGGPNPFD